MFLGWVRKNDEKLTDGEEGGIPPKMVWHPGNPLTPNVYSMVEWSLGDHYLCHSLDTPTHPLYWGTLTWILFGFTSLQEDTGFGCKRGGIMWAPLKTMDLEKILFQDRCWRNLSNFISIPTLNCKRCMTKIGKDLVGFLVLGSNLSFF
jgi:hypothetical protein